MTVKLIVVTAVLLLALLIPTAALAHTEPPPNQGCLKAHGLVHCFIANRLTNHFRLAALSGK
jgi:hypothetical protein